MAKFRSLLTLDEAATYLAVSKTTLRRWTNDGRLACHRVGPRNERRFDPEVLDALGHIILSHHGAYEYGSPKLPATPEAFMVCYIDDLDAKINQVTSAIDNEQSDSNWTAWQNALQTRLYRKRLE